MTRAPPRCSACAATRPERARPMTATFSPRNVATSIMPLPQLQGGAPGDRQVRGDDPEADDDGRLLPAFLLEMLVKRRKTEDALAGQLEARHLDDDRHHLQHEEPADDRQD